MGIRDQLKHAWNAFTSPEPTPTPAGAVVTSYSPMSTRRGSLISNDRSIVTTVVTRLASDLAMLDLVHARVDENERYVQNVDSGIHSCLTFEANLDQSAFAFKHEVAMGLMERGVIAVVPVDTTLNPRITGGYDIKTLRTGYITEWLPRHVKVEVYNDRTGQRQVVTMDKSNVAIIHNPLYAIMNEPNSTLQRLIRKLALLDTSDEAQAANKLDLIIQLPYTVKTEQKKAIAQRRREEIEFQLRQGDLGIAYTDGAESITQLNRPVENNILASVEHLTAQLYSQLGLTKEILEGSASEDVMQAYQRRTVEPIAKVITEELGRKFLTKTARTQGQRILYLRSQFDFVSTSNIGDVFDKLIRNEVLTSNEARSIIGFRPSDNPAANELRNPNMPVDDTSNPDPPLEPQGDQNGKE